MYKLSGTYPNTLDSTSYASCSVGTSWITEAATSCTTYGRGGCPILVKHIEGGSRRHAKLLSRHKPVPVLIENVLAGFVLIPGDAAISISIKSCECVDGSVKLRSGDEPVVIR